MVRKISRIKSGNFGHQVNSDNDIVCFIFSIFGITKKKKKKKKKKHKETKQLVKIPMRRLLASRLIRISTVCKCMSEFT